MQKREEIAELQNRIENVRENQMKESVSDGKKIKHKLAEPKAFGCATALISFLAFILFADLFISMLLFPT